MQCVFSPFKIAINRRKWNVIENFLFTKNCRQKQGSRPKHDANSPHFHVPVTRVIISARDN
jgi:hypothetical protein